MVQVRTPPQWDEGGVPAVDDAINIWDTSESSMKHYVLNRLLALAYYVDASQADQGAVSVDADKTFKDLVDLINSDNATIFLPHHGSAFTTYTFTTPEVSPENVFIEIQAGALISGTLEIYSPANIIASPGQQIFAAGATITFTNPGVLHPGHYGVVDLSGTNNSAAAISACFAALSTGATVKFPEGKIRVDTACALDGEQNITFFAYGTTFVSESDIVLFNLNNSAAVARNIKWFGGFFEHDDGTSTATNNTATALGVDDIRDLTIRDVKFGGTGGLGWNKCIAGGIKDNARIENCYAYACDQFFDLNNPPSGGVAQIISIVGNNLATIFNYAINLDVRFSDVWIERNAFSGDKYDWIYAVTGSGSASEESINLQIVKNTFEQRTSPNKYIVIGYDSNNYLNGLKVKDNQFVATAACVTGDRIKDLHVSGNNFANAAATAISVTNCMGTIKVTGNYFGQTASGTAGTYCSITAAAGEYYRTIWGGNEYADWNDHGACSVPFERLHNWDTPVFFGPFNSYQGDGTELLKGNLQSDTFAVTAVSDGSSDLTVTTDVGVDSMWYETPPDLIRAVYIHLRARDSDSAANSASVTVQPKMTANWGVGALALVLDGVKDDEWRDLIGWVPVDADGKITITYNATGEDTLDIDLYYLGYK